MTVVRIRKYRGANILILNEWQKFIYIIFLKGKFYAYDFEISKRGDYTNREYLQALDAANMAAKSTVDTLYQRSPLRKFFKEIYAKTILRFKKGRVLLPKPIQSGEGGEPQA